MCFKIPPPCPPQLCSYSADWKAEKQVMLLVISISLKLVSVAMSRTCQACNKLKIGSFLISLLVKCLDEDMVVYHMRDWCIHNIRGFTSPCNTWIRHDDFLRFLGSSASIWANGIVSVRKLSFYLCTFKKLAKVNRRLGYVIYIKIITVLICMDAENDLLKMCMI